MDTARLEAKKIALKSCEKAYCHGDPVWFKLDSSHKWKSGIILGQDGKILFIRYGNFIRRVPLDCTIPADEYQEETEDDIDPDDIKHDDRLQDDAFQNVEVVAIKDKEIEKLQKSNIELDNYIQFWKKSWKLFKIGKE